MGVIEPGSSKTTLLHLTAIGLLGDRVIELSCRCQPISEDPGKSTLPAAQEILKSISLPVVNPFSCDFNTTFFPRVEISGNRSLDDADDWHDAQECELGVRLAIDGPHELQIVSMELDLVVCQTQYRGLLDS